MQLFNEKKLALIHTMLKRKGQTLAVAESVTAGLLQAAISQAEFASEFFQGGVTVYNLGQKVKQLDIEPIHAEQQNCVSEKVSIQMAAGICKMFNCQWGISITGYATPVPESGNKLFAYYAIAQRKKILVSGKLTSGKKEPFEVQHYYIQKVLTAFLTALK